MKKWEYMIIDSDEIEGGGKLHLGLSGPGKEAVRKFLNKIGSEGWEVVNIDFLDELRSHFMGLAKREIG